MVPQKTRSLAESSRAQATRRPTPPSCSAATAMASLARLVTLFGVPFLRPPVFGVPGFRPAILSRSVVEKSSTEDRLNIREEQGEFWHRTSIHNTKSTLSAAITGNHQQHVANK